MNEDNQSTQPPSLDEATIIDPQQKCLCVVIVDTSSSMTGAPINALNDSLIALRDALRQDELASTRVELALISFDSEVRVLQDFTAVNGFEPPKLSASGSTHMGSAIQKGFELVQNRKSQLKAMGIPYYRPWMFLLTDGEPIGEPKEAMDEAQRLIMEAEKQKRLLFFSVGVENANMQLLNTITPRESKKLHGLNFQGLFLWLSASLSEIAKSQNDAVVALPEPAWEDKPTWGAVQS